MEVNPPSELNSVREELKREKEENPREGARSSPPPNCAICLGPSQNKSFTDSCLHQFCFNCLLTWSKIKAECPLCKQTFKSIIHNVRSNHQYEEYLVEQRAIEVETIPVPETPEPIRRFRYRTTITFPRSEGSAIEQLLVRHADVVLPPQRESQARRPFRQAVYRHNLWARFLPDFTGRLRECSPEFYAANEAQKYRLIPWLTRELEFLLDNNHSHISYVIAQILDLITVCSIMSPEFHRAMLPFLRDRTEHFLHELLVFASTPFDLLGYDRNVQYDPDPRLAANNVNHVITSSESDSDVVMVDRGESQPASNVIPIETISHSDSDDSSSEVIMTGYIKPPQDRTPEVVDLLASDSDVLVQESPPPSTSREIPSASALVKLTLSRRRPHLPRLPDSSDEEYVPRVRSKRRMRSQDSASTTSTRRDTESDSSDASSRGREPSPSYTPPLPDTHHPKRRKDKRKKIKKKRERSRSPKPRERRKHKKLKKVKRSKREKCEKTRKTSDHDRRVERESKLRRVISALPTGSHSKYRLNATVTSQDEPGSSGLGRARELSSDTEERRPRTRAPPLPSTSDSDDDPPRTRRPPPLPSTTDSDDDLPLNLTVRK